MKKHLALMALLSLYGQGGNYQELTDEERINTYPKQKPKMKGLKTFIIEGKEIEAISWKSAHKKYKKLYGTS